MKKATQAIPCISSIRGKLLHLSLIILKCKTLYPRTVSYFDFKAENKSQEEEISIYYTYQSIYHSYFSDTLSFPF